MTESNNSTNQNKVAETIIVIDDDVTLSHTLSRAFTRRGFTVSIANDREQALALCRRQHFNRAVLDLKLAETSGLQLIPELLDLQKELAIVILTGYSSIATAVEAIKLGAVNYLCKPADADEILAGFEQSKRAVTETIAGNPPSVDRLEWEHIQKVLQQHDGNISATARALNMHRRTLQRKLQKYPVKR